MNILHFIDDLNRSRGWHIDGAYYQLIQQWRDWWRGSCGDFHTVRMQGMDGNLYKREMYRLRMPKRCCEDWAALLLNDKTTVTVEDAAAARWLLGDAGQTGGVLGALQFWPRANELVELAFRSGTGAFVMGVEGLTVQNGQAIASPHTKICMDYLPAECILPVTVRHGQVVDAAFASEVTVNGRPCVYLQTHQLTGSGYRITNELFTCEGEQFSPAPLPPGMADSFVTGSPVPWFALVRPAILKNRDGGAGLGMAVFAEAIDQAKQCDLAFDNYCMDIALGGKKVFYNKTMLKSWVDEQGVQHFAAPDDIRQQLFVHTAGFDPDAEPDWHEYNPDLRVEANSRAVQDALDYFSFKTGLGTRRYQFTASGVKTATEYTGDRQDMVQHANRHQIQIEAALLQIMRALLWAGKTLLGQNFDENTPVTVNFDDSYITDTGTRRETDRQDVRDGLWPKYRYLMEWRGLSEADAKAAVAEAADAEPPLTFGGA